MRVLTVTVFALFLMSCTSAPAPAPEASAPAAGAAQLKGNLLQVMRGILFPNSNIIFDAQSNDPGAVKAPDSKAPAAGATAAFAGVYGGWEAVENASIALGEAANLISMPGRSCANGKPVPLNDPTYQKGLAALREASGIALKAAQAKNMDQILDAADKVTMACSTCHDVYRDVQVDGKPAGIEARCNPTGK